MKKRYSFSEWSANPFIAERLPLIEVVQQIQKTYQMDYLSFFIDWSNNLQHLLKQSLPDIGNDDAYRDTCEIVQDANETKMDAIRIRDEIANTIPVDEAALSKANQAIADADEELQKKVASASLVAEKIILRPDIQDLLDSEYDDSDLMTYTVIMEATPAKLAQWCDLSLEKSLQLLSFLKDKTAVRKFLQSGGARFGEYPRALEIYHQLNPDPCNVVLDRLALAVSLELSAPYPLFGTPSTSVDPIQRYIHYEQSYLLGELDPYFPLFNAWEMRHIVNSDATENELGWGRASLMNYRQDIVYSDDHQWRYCWIVRSDVTYNDPDWYKEPRSYDQILSGGGKCGPRAWYGRFICKTFGIPTWGVTQPNHAAMARWTLDGWCMCLGAAFQYSLWEGECGLNFQLSTQAMKAVGSEDEYMKKVRRLEWIGFFSQENPDTVKGSFLPSPVAPWWSLSLFQRMRLVQQRTCTNCVKPSLINIVRDVKGRVNQNNEQYRCPVSPTSDRSILIPAASCWKPATTTNEILFMRSFSGGQQLFIQQDGQVEYIFELPIFDKSPLSYAVTCQVCTVHRTEKPITLVVISDGKDLETISITLPYTMGMWSDTNPVLFRVSPTKTNSFTLRFKREMQLFGFAFKSFTLTSVTSSGRQ